MLMRRGCQPRRCWAPANLDSWSEAKNKVNCDRQVPGTDLALASAAANALAAMMQLRQPPTVSVSSRRSGSLEVPAELLSKATVEAVR